MTEPTQDSTPKEQKTITTGKIAGGVAGGIALFVVGVGTIQSINQSMTGGPELQSFNEGLERIQQMNEESAAQSDQRAMDCSVSRCAIVTGQNLVKWPLSVVAPITVTCGSDRPFIQAGNQWYERNEKPESTYPSWKKIQKVEGFWPFQYRVGLKFLGEEITKACQG
jgi:hypothetical protein